MLKGGRKGPDISSCDKDGEGRTRTVPQNSRRQWGHCPTIRKTAWLQRGSDWSWQRFLAGMMDRESCEIRRLSDSSERRQQSAGNVLDRTGWGNSHDGREGEICTRGGWKETA